MDATAFAFKAPLKGRLGKIPVIGGIIFKKIYGWGMFLQYFQNDVFYDASKVDTDLVRDFYEAFDTPERRAYMHSILPAVTDGLDVEPHVAKVKQPCLVLWGAKDTLVPLHVGHRLEKELADVRFEIIPNAGHQPHSENLDETMRHILDFLE
jgi:pimeloyl-ACP methyl ester carboxylesterase